MSGKPDYRASHHACNDVMLSVLLPGHLLPGQRP
jgi:hypothetical protein